MNKVSVRNVQQVGHRFDADVTVGWPDYPESDRSFHVHTNDNGRGLWTGDAQCYGTCQFDVSTKEAFRSAVRRAFL